MKQLSKWNYARTFESVLASFSFGTGEVAAILYFCCSLIDAFAPEDK